MNNLVLYMVQSGVSLIIFYLVYFVFLSKETLFKVSRYYLMLTALASFIIPFIELPSFSESSTAAFSYVLETITVSPEGESPAWWQGLLNLSTVYYTGIIILMLRLLFRLIQLAFIIIPSKKSSNGMVTFVFNAKVKQPFSFFNYIVISEQIYNSKHREEIIAHELIHINQRHTLDVLILELLTAVQWFNPAIWMMRSSLKGVHEYLADNGVMNLGYSLKRYHNAILSQTFGYPELDITHNFNSSKLKKRILMMNRKQSGVAAKLKVVFAIPIVIIISVGMSAFIMSCNNNIQDRDEVTTQVQVMAKKTPQQVSESKKSAKQIPPPPPPPLKKSGSGTPPPPPPPPVEDSKVYSAVEKMPRFPGGDKGRVNFLTKNVKYPEEAVEKGIQGVVYVSFIVEKDGSINEAKVLRGIGYGCDEEALRVVKIMPKWDPGMHGNKPVRTSFSMPFRFTLSE